jgi:hypothetical protein
MYGKHWLDASTSLANVVSYLRQFGEPARQYGKVTFVLFAKHWLCSPNFSDGLPGVEKDWQRLAQAVADRRRQLGLSQDGIRQAGGPSDVVVARIEANDAPHPRDDTINKLDVALEWEPGSARSVLAGGQPRPTERSVDLTDMSDDELLAELCRRLAMRHNKPEHPVPVGFIRSPYATRQGSGVGGDEEGDQRRQLGG